MAVCLGIGGGRFTRSPTFFPGISNPLTTRPAQIIGGNTLTGAGAGAGFAGARRTVPYVVALDISIGDGMALCTGAIIDSTHIISAAHCVSDDRTNRQVASTATIVITNNRNARPIWSGAGSVSVHPGYASRGGKKKDTHARTKKKIIIFFFSQTLRTI